MGAVLCALAGRGNGMGARLAGIDDGFQMFHGLCISSRFTASTARFPSRLEWLAMQREPFWPEDAGPWGPDPSRFLQPHFFLGRGVVSGKDRILRLGIDMF